MGTISGRKNVCKALGVGRVRAEQWIEKGAPVSIEGEGRHARWFADADVLEAWRQDHLKPRRATRSQQRPRRRSRSA